MAQVPRTSPVATQTADIERRASVRYPCDLDSSCQPVTASRGHQWTGKVRDVSRGGIGLILSRRFELGTLLTVEVQGPAGRSSGSLLARVVHITPSASGEWIIGCCFVNELSEDEVRALV